MSDAHVHAHEGQNDSLFKIALNLTLACFISGAIIAGTYAFTNPIAEKKMVQLKEDAMKDLVKDAETFQPVEGKDNWYVAVKGGEEIAYVVPGESKGYGGKIEMLVAVTPDGKVIDYNIIKMNETPGLGDKGAKEPFKTQFAGKAAEQLEVTKDPSNQENIQALTGATITSRAVTKGVRDAVEEVTEFTGVK
ncbi:RnfABCDGE type electron transport complex subunit G [Candidatus Formimonas warabiya]|uniref:Ion-translocating oxidoreductase complex subunit G n=1 Tax=Formimonas warabiya TaxID=1761012 RepID=A0A3G1KTW6_FORW1|nr:RnfABCDGE type electron transport complex subunit G [Candidatus Formimonas warabiya]ATW25901.1 RnfABCDGE type electron transport complex subunit G [Candidatus Formimonas warabiya]